jgi:hypothetical protein
MPISNDEAVKVAKAHGLSLQDAATLAQLATDPDEATKLAAEFTGKHQLGEQQLGNMTTEQINAARRAGRLDQLMGRDQ